MHAIIDVTALFAEYYTSCGWSDQISLKKVMRESGQALQRCLTSLHLVTNREVFCQMLRAALKGLQQMGCNMAITAFFLICLFFPGLLMGSEVPTYTCNYNSTFFGQNPKIWCKRNLNDSNCCDTIATTQILNSSAVRITDDKNGLITVNVNSYTSQEEGTYWCGVIQDGHIFVLEEFTIFNRSPSSKKQG
ncbi:uncharacterized protein LOC122806572 isoform X2 [Protopterus annectens]|uniref:uncharacterized protein LOC122806572 isoform X2 n=1 Tax=Protopterus annectens TaxID=7888 RepID=UPI001CF95676|nr:uncharacterized protein LOC122806572 isoform X2 [Protopterus annectens]